MVIKKKAYYILFASCIIPLFIITTVSANTPINSWKEVAPQLNIANIITYNDSSGDAIYGGTTSGGQLYKYNISLGGWSLVAAQLSSQGIRSITTYNDGSGTAIYGGTSTGGRLFKYNTSLGGWSQVAAQLSSQQYILSLTTYNDGSGNAIYGGTANNGLLFKYNVSLGGWSQVAAQLNLQKQIYTLTTYNDGSGDAIYGGAINGTSMGGLLFKYNVSLGGWSQVAAQLSSQSELWGLTTYNDGSGTAIYGGTYSGGRLFKYNVSLGGWSQVAAQLNSQTRIDSNVVYNDGSGDAIYGGTGGGGRLFKYNVSLGGWSQVAAQLNSQIGIWSLITYNDGSGTAIYGSTASGGNLFKAYWAIAPLANFTSDKTQGVIPQDAPIQFSDTSENIPTSWNWSFGDSSYSSLQNPLKTYYIMGIYNVTLIATNAAGSNTTTKTNYITIYNSTESLISANRTYGGYPCTIQFNLTKGVNETDATEWNWSFGDGSWFNTTNVSEKNATKTYNSAGLYTVRTITSNNLGDYNSSIQLFYIRVANPVISGFIANITSGVSPLPVRFNVTIPKDNATEWNWSFGDNISLNGTSQNVTHTYQTTGTFTVSEMATNRLYSLPNWSQVAATFGETNQFSLSKYNDGSGDAIFGGMGSSGRLFKYNVSLGGWSQVAAQLNLQAYIYSLTQYNDGSGDAIYGGTGGDGRLFKYNASLGGWSQVAAQLNSQTSIYSLTTYNDGSGNAIYGGTYPSGLLFKYNVSLGGWSQVAAQLNSQGTIYSLTTFDDRSGNAIYGGTGSDARLFKYNASLANWSQVAAAATNSIQVNSLIVYNDGSGNAIYGGTANNGLLFKYNVSLGGWSQVAAQLNSQATIYSLTTFDDSSGNAIYGGTGGGGLLFKYNVSLGGWSQVAPQFNSQQDIRSLITFNNGDGEAIYGGTYTIYSGGQLFQFGLRPVISNTTTLTNYIVVYNETTSGFTADPHAGLFTLTVPFNVTSMDDNATQWNWDFGDGTVENITVSASRNATHKYSTGGTYTVSLMTNNTWDTNTTILTDYVIVYNTTISGFTADPHAGFFPLTVPFNVTSVDDNATQWNWDFGDGTTSNITVSASRNATHKYSTGGTYNVSLMTNNTWDTNTTTLTNYVIVYNTTISGFIADPHAGLFMLTVPFNVTSMDDNATQWNWDFGDGTVKNITVSASRNATHKYSTGSTYTVSLMTNNTWDTNTTTLTDYVIVYNHTHSGFTADPHAGFFPLTVLFNITSMDDNATQWNWDFGDGTASNITDPTSRNATHTYSSGGTYTVSLMTNNTADIDTTTLMDYIVVLNWTYANYTANVTWGHVPLAVQFTDIGNNATSWNWSFGDGGTSTDQNPVHTYGTAGIYRVILNTTGIYNDATSSRLLIQAALYNVTPTSTPTPTPTNLQAQFVGYPTSGAVPLSVGFTDLSTGYPTSWNWSFGDGNYSESQNPTYEYNAPGTYTVRLNVSDSGGYNITQKTGYITVAAGTTMPTFLARFIGNPVSGANPLTVHFTDISLGSPTVWNWSFGDGRYSDSPNPTHQYTSVNNYTVSLNISTDIEFNISEKTDYIIVTSGIPTVIPTVTATPQPLNIKSIKTEVGETWIKWSWTWNSTNTTPLIYIDGEQVEDTTGNQIIVTNLSPRSGHTLEIYTNEGRGFVTKKDITTLASTFDIELYFVISIVITTIGLFAVKEPGFKIILGVVGLVIALYALNIAYGFWLYLPIVPALFAGIVIIYNAKEIISNQDIGKW